MRAAACGARGFFLEVGEFNRTARRLYDSRGLVPIGRRRHYYEFKDGGTMDALTMRRELAAPRHTAAEAARFGGGAIAAGAFRP